MWSSLYLLSLSDSRAFSNGTTLLRTVWGRWLLWGLYTVKRHGMSLERVTSAASDVMQISDWYLSRLIYKDIGFSITLTRLQSRYSLWTFRMLTMQLIVKGINPLSSDKTWLDMPPAAAPLSTVQISTFSRVSLPTMAVKESRRWVS